MNIKVKALIWWIAPLLSIVSFAAPGSDPRLADAVKNKDKAAVRSLLKQHVDVNTPQADGSTALAWAAHWNDLETADLLIRAGANVNAANDYGVTPLWEACNNGSAAMVEKLVKAGANPNATLPGTGETVLMRCARTGNADAVKSLLARGADVNAKEPARGADGSDVGIGGTPPGGRAGADRARRGRPCQVEGRLHAVAVCRPAGRYGICPDAGGRGSGRE